MKRLKLGLLAYVIATSASFAQELPYTLPANTVVGRTSIGPGQATAVPFEVLASQLSQFGLLTNPLTFAEFPAIGANTVIGSVAGGTPAALSSTQITAMINTAALTGIPISTGISGLGTGVSTALGTALNASGGLVGVSGALGTPSSGTLTNATGLPIGTGVSGLATGAATFLGTATSANLRALLTDESGTGAALFQNGALGTPTSGTISTGMTLGGVTMGLGSDATGDVYYNNGGVLTRLPKGSNGQVLELVSGIPAWASASGTGTVNAAGTGLSLSGGGSTVNLALRSYLAGLTLSTAGSSSTFGIAAGMATDSTNVSMMALTAYTKTTGAWTVGSASGALDTGSIANTTWYHVFLMQRTDTGVVDVCVSVTVTGCTTGGNIPAAYTLFRRIGSMLTNGSAQWVAFSQLGDEFLWKAPVTIVNGAAVPTSATLLSLATGIPTGIQPMARLRGFGNGTSANGMIFQSPDETSAVGNATPGNLDIIWGTGGQGGGNFLVRTDTSANVRWSAAATTALGSLAAFGWIDTRGKMN